MEAFRIAPPLSLEVLVAGFSRVSDGEADVVQLYIGVSAAAADVEHEKFHISLLGIQAPARFTMLVANDSARGLYKSRTSRAERGREQQVVTRSASFQPKVNA
jgi:uncharacterized protein YhbP (UPF0306 family)